MYPIIVLSVTGLITLFLGLENKNSKAILPSVIFFFIIALLSNFIDWNNSGLYFNNMIEVNNTNILLQSIIIVAALLVSLVSSGQFTDEHAYPAEYYSLMQFSVVGALVMATFNNLLMLFVGLEILSIALYILTGSDKRNLRGNEAALKYFLMGAFATGILLFGIAMLYGATGSLFLGSGSDLAAAGTEFKILFYIGVVFTLAGLLFKISAAPFHFWTADVYQGAPTVFTAFMATIVKTAVIVALYRIVAFSFAFEYEFWSRILIGIVILSLVIGNVTAVLQDNFKRILAFSGISQAGFLLMSLIGLSEKSLGNIGFYSASYTLATITALGVLVVVSQNSPLKDGRSNENVEVFKGLFKRNPCLGVAMLISMLSLAGIPLTSGFWGKLFVFTDAISKGYLWLLITAILMSAVSLYYYLKPVVASFKESDQASIELKPLHKVVLYLCTALTILLGVVPSIWRDLF